MTKSIRLYRLVLEHEINVFLINDVVLARDLLNFCVII